MAEASPKTPASAALDPGADISSQIDIEAMSLEQAEQLLRTGKAELPLKSSGEGTVQDDPPAAKVTEAKAGDTPLEKTETPAATVEEVTETRTAEEIQAAQDAAVATVVEAGGDEAAQQAAAEEAAKPQAKVEEPPAKPEVDEEAKRFRVKDPMARAALSIYKAMEAAGTPISLAEAEKRVTGGVAPVAPAKAEPPVDHVAIVGTLETEVADLESKIDAAGEGEGLITKAFTDLTKELAKKTTALELARRDMKQAADHALQVATQRKAASKAARQASKDAAAAEYPDAIVEGSALDLAIKAEIAALGDTNHPDNALLFADSAPELITQRVAKRLKIAPKVATASPPVKKIVAAPAITKLSPVPGGKTSVTPGATTEGAKAKKAEDYLTSGAATLQDLDASAGAATPSPALAALLA